MDLNNTKGKLNTLQSSSNSESRFKPIQCGRVPASETSSVNKETFKVHNGPPCTAKILLPDESLEDFLNQHIEHTNGISDQNPLLSIQQHNEVRVQDREREREVYYLQYSRLNYQVSKIQKFK